jgi:hypothetical protein
METVLQQKLSVTYTSQTRQTSLVTRFIDWCKSQEENRFGWVAASIAGHGCFLTPLTVLALVFTGNSMFLWALAIGAMGIVLISNLAAMPTKIIIPVLLLSVLIDLGVILSSIVALFTVIG